jgi:uncharacterized 2Fe-2S/4Fe-4S cluster protein (DUF4445 family)
VGICGSGLVDAIAAMLGSGVIDETGRIDDGNEAFADRIRDIDGITSFVLEEAANADADMEIAITQKDVREFQNAKAAIAAGVRVLIKEAGISVGDIAKVYLAGGFGNYINVKSAMKIGLLPPELEGRVESIGNGAGSGAIECLLSVEMIRESVRIKQKIRYLELSSRPDFINEYVECMMFE